jgi:hemerythrin-like domain-containing protein
LSKQELFRHEYDIPKELLLDLLQQAMTALPTVTAHRLTDDGDRIRFRTSFTLTSWGEKMVAAVEANGPDRSVLTVSGEPLVGLLSSRWGEEIHASTIEAQLRTAVASEVSAARTNPILMLQADHRRVEQLFARIAAADADHRAPLVEELIGALRVHMELEEVHVYPILGKQVDERMAAESEVEHELARDALAQLEELAPDEPGFDGAMTMLMAGIEHHVAEEETEAFPALVAELGPNGLAELAQRLTAARAELLKDLPDGDQPKRHSRPARPKRASAPARTTRSGRSRRTFNPDDHTRAELLERAKEQGVSGSSHMTKDELAKALA